MSKERPADRIASFCFIAAVAVIGVTARVFLLPTASPDQKWYLDPWFERINELGAAGTLRDGIGDYMPPYYWIMIVINALPVKNKVYGLKAVSCTADLITAFLVMRIVRRLTGNDVKADISFAAAFMMPSVLLDSAAWGQCDSIYTMFLVLCLSFLIEGRDLAAMMSFSVSFVFKQQAIFLVPLLLVLILKKHIRLRTLVTIPAAYLAAILPSAVCGRSITSLLTVYISQAYKYPKLCMTLPNVWAMVRGIKNDWLGMAGVMFAGTCCLTGIYYLWRREQEPGIKGTVTLAALSALFVPYVLPYMHERYYYPATVLTLMLVFLDKRLVPVWLVIEFASATSMLDFLYEKDAPDLRVTAVLVTAALIAMFVYYCKLDGNDRKIPRPSEKPVPGNKQ